MLNENSKTIKKFEASRLVQCVVFKHHVRAALEHAKTHEMEHPHDKRCQENERVVFLFFC